MSDQLPPPPPPPGDVPPPPPPPMPPAGSPDAAQYNPGDSVTWAWKKFQENAGAILIAMVALFVIGAVISIVWYLIVAAIEHAIYPGTSVDLSTGRVSAGATPGFFMSLIFGALGFLVYGLVVGFIQAAVTRAALVIADGKKIETSTILSTNRLGELIITAVVLAVLQAIGYMFCGVGALVVMFFAAFTWYFLLDQGNSPIDAVKSSFSFVSANIGQVLIFFLICIVVYAIGAILCLIGLIVALPVIVLATAYTYRRLRGEPVAA